MAQENPFDQFDGQAAPVPVQQLQPIIGANPFEAQQQQREEIRIDMEMERLRLAQDEAERKRIEFEQEQAKTSATPARDVSDVRAELENVVSKARRAKELSREWFASGFGSGTAKGVAGTAAADLSALLDTIGGNIAFDRLSRMRAESPTGGALGNVTERELALLQSTVASLSQAQSDEQFRQSMDDVINAYGRVLNKLPAEGVEEPSRPSPLETASKAPQTEVTGEGETFLTPEDIELQGRLTAAYNGGASLSELQSIAGEYNRTFPIATQEALDAARAEGRAVNINPSGRRSAAGEVLGDVFGDPGVGAAYFTGAANALLSGYMDELAPAVGLDSATVQAAKEELRDENFLASMAGEVSGGLMQLAIGRGVGPSGTVATRAKEVAQGAAYGSGEANEDRLLGAVTGGGAAFLGQEIGKRLLEPAAQAIIQRISRETGAPKEAVEEVVAQSIQRAETRATGEAAEEITPEAAEEVGAVVRDAIGKGRRAQEAQERLAIMAQVNPEAKEAAARLGLELPIDVLSDDVRLRTTTGLARSQIGSDAQSAWGRTVSDAIERSDETLREIGATRDLAQVSDDVRARLQQSIDSLERQGDELRSQIDDTLEPTARVDAQNLQDALAQTINDLGGLDEAKQAFTTQERQLLAMLGEGEEAVRPTYARLNQIRDQIGRAIYRNQGPWVDAPTANLKAYYAALAKDQLAHVETIGGQEAAQAMRASNELFSQMYAQREAMQSIFGKQLSRDLGPLINRAISSGRRGDATALRQLLEPIPEDMRGSVLLSGIMAQSQRPGANGGFSFTKYAQTYRGLRENGPIYSQIAREVGEPSAQILQDLYAISRRVADAENKIIRTGASTQPLINAINAETLVGRVMGAGKRVGTRATGAIAGGTVGGPVGASAGYEISSALEQALTRGGKSRLDQLHGVLSSDAFRDLVEKAASGESTQRAVNRVANSRPFVGFARRFLRLNTEAERRAWLSSAGAVTGAQAAQPEQQPTSTIEVQ